MRKKLEKKMQADDEFFNEDFDDMSNEDEYDEEKLIQIDKD